MTTQSTIPGEERNKIKEVTSRITQGIYDGGYVDVYYKNDKLQSVSFRTNDGALFFNSFNEVNKWHKELGEIIKYLESRDKL